MAVFKEYVKARGTGVEKMPKVGRFELFRIVRKYPWFTTARIVRTALYDSEDERVYLSRLFPAPEKADRNQGDLREAIETKVVDNFLALGKYAINQIGRAHF